MKVIATKPGFDGQRLRHVGDGFEVTPDQFSDAWMERVPADTDIPPSPAIPLDEFGNPILLKPAAEVLKEFLKTPAKSPKKAKATA